MEIDPCENCLRFKDSGLVVKQDCDLPEKNGALVSASAYQMLMEKAKKDKTYQVWAASLADINKALQEKKYTNPETQLPEWINRKLMKLFDRKEANKLPPYRPGIDHHIELEKDADGKTPEAP